MNEITGGRLRTCPCVVTSVVELRGFEPLAFSLRTRRATNCATAPYLSRKGTKSPRLTDNGLLA